MEGDSLWPVSVSQPASFSGDCALTSIDETQGVQD